MNFDERVLALLKKIPKGKVTTYKLIAKKMKTRAYRAIGSACHNNPKPIVIPCHRVVRNDGTIAFCCNSCYRKRIRLLRNDGIKIRRNMIVDFEKVLFKF
ncbi:MAG: MGMT family protein [Candidatus Aenigmatarchaeota archaeon]